MLMVERAYIYVGKEDWQYQQNRGEISPGELHHGGTRDLIRMDIHITRHLGYGRDICGSVEGCPGNLFALYFILKDKIPLDHCRISKYNASQESPIGTPKSSNISKKEAPKFSVIMHSERVPRRM